MFIAMNRFKVIKEERKAFEDLWVARQSHLDEVKGSGHFTYCAGRSARTMCSIHLIQYGRRKRILRLGPSPNNSAPPINTRASASRSHSGTRNSKGSKSSRRSKLRIRRIVDPKQASARVFSWLSNHSDRCGSSTTGQK